MQDKKYSAIDAIYIILEKLSKLEEKIDLVNSNVNELSKKVYVLNSRVSKLKKENNYEKTTATPMAKSVDELKNNYTANNSTQENSGLFLGKIKLYGYIKNTEKNPIHGVRVELLKNKEKIRNLSTNRDGYWEARVPSGVYEVIYTLKGYKPVSKILNLLENMKEYEVE